ncbi:MAG: four helix bundle protein [Candidatus Omnitrophota bacterium]|nr:four helix bundle protein [Candidatus Omnitrophota bacterium]
MKKAEERDSDSVPRYRKLLVWQKAHKNAIFLIQLLDKCNPKYARIFDQCIGAVTSIGANIAEGNVSGTNKQKENYFQIALNSSYELDNWLQILKDTKTICSNKESVSALEKENIEIIKILSTIISNLSS